MSSLSPNNIVSSFEWLFDELDGNNILFASYNTNIERTTSHNSSNSSPQLQYFEYDKLPNSSSNNAADKPSNFMRKSSHNEYERDRRKKLGKIYSSLRELLPEKDRKKKMSIPCTIACVLKYIPELQRHIERLACEKEEILLRASKKESSTNFSKGVINPVISATFLSRREIMIQICILNTNAMIPFSKVSKFLEREHGLNLMNASTQTTCDGKILYSIHLQVRDNVKIESQSFYERLMSSLVS